MLSPYPFSACIDEMIRFFFLMYIPYLAVTYAFIPHMHSPYPFGVWIGYINSICWFHVWSQCMSSSYGFNDVFQICTPYLQLWKQRMHYIHALPISIYYRDVMRECNISILYMDSPYRFNICVSYMHTLYAFSTWIGHADWVCELKIIIQYMPSPDAFSIWIEYVGSMYGLNIWIPQMDSVYKSTMNL